MYQAPFRSTTLGRKYCIEGIPQNIISPRSVGTYQSRVSEVIKQPVFVIGSPRSGTTVLGKTLGLNQHIACADESLYLLDLFRMFYNLHHGERPNASTPLRQYIGGSDLLHAQQQLAESIFSGILRSKKTIYLDQTPWYGPIGAYINLLFGDARFIHIIRNGYNVVNSLGQSYNILRYQWAGRDVTERTLIWVNMVLASQELRQLGENRYMEVRYEDFLVNPTKTLKLICDFIGVKFSQEMLHGLAVNHTLFTGTSKAISLSDVRIQDCGEQNNMTAIMNEYPQEFLSIGGNLMQSLNYI